MDHSSDTTDSIKRIGLRDHNERLVLTLVRRHGSLAKSDIARLTGLSAQAASVIVGSLEADDLLVRGEPQRGKVGQPSIPFSINPQGACSFGLNCGRRSTELLLTDFIGNVRAQRRRVHRFTTPSEVLQFAHDAIGELRAELTDDDIERIAGIGLSMPFEMWNWGELAGAPPEDMQAWRDVVLEDELAKQTQLPVLLRNDASSACGAELFFGIGQQYDNYLYFFIGTFIGGGLVINRQLHTGKHGYSGAVGTFPIINSDASMSQLIDHASLVVLEAELEKSLIDTRKLWQEDVRDWSEYGAVLDQWLQHTAQCLAVASLGASSVVELDAIVIDGALPDTVRWQLVKHTEQAFEKLQRHGIEEPVFVEGTLGRQARALGGASLPLMNRFFVE